jgi:hypothetical protein
LRKENGKVHPGGGRPSHPGAGIAAAPVENSLALAPNVRYNAAHLRLLQDPAASPAAGRPPMPVPAASGWKTDVFSGDLLCYYAGNFPVCRGVRVRFRGPARGEPRYQVISGGKDAMIRKTAISAVLIAGAVILLSAMTLLAQDKMFTYDYSFKPGSEPDGFRTMKWQTDIATLDPLHTMEVIEILGPFVYYRKNTEDLHLVNVQLDNIIYEFWNGKFSGVIIKVRGDNQFQILKDYVFARFGPGQRSKVLQQMGVQDFYYNGVKTRMYLRFSDINRTGELSLYSIALLSKQQHIDVLYLREKAKAKIDAWERSQPK